MAFVCCITIFIERQNMAHYLASGKDGSSDNGYWDVLIQCANKRQASKILRDHLKDLNQEKLLDHDSFRMELNNNKNILYSSVEHRN